MTRKGHSKCFSCSPVKFMSICRCMFVLEQREKVPSTGSASSGSGCIFLLESSWVVGRSRVTRSNLHPTVILSATSEPLTQLLLLWIQPVFRSCTGKIVFYLVLTFILKASQIRYEPEDHFKIFVRTRSDPSGTVPTLQASYPIIKIHISVKKDNLFRSHAPSPPPQMYLLIHVKPYGGTTERKHSFMVWHAAQVRHSSVIPVHTSTPVYILHPQDSSTFANIWWQPAPNVPWHSRKTRE